MNKTIWTSSVAALIVGLSVVGHATAVAPPGADADSQGSYSAGALYNLGNSYAQQGKPALAVLAYERARMLAPLDPDIRANLRKVRESAGLPANSNSFSDHLRWISPNTTYWIGLIGLLLAGIGWVQLGLNKSYRLASRVTTAVGLMLVAFTVSDAIATEPLMDRSVVLQTAAASAVTDVGGRRDLHDTPSCRRAAPRRTWRIHAHP